MGARALYAAYVAYCEEIHERPWRMNLFAQEMEKRGYHARRVKQGVFRMGLLLNVV